MAIRHVVPGAQHKRTGGVPQKRYHTCCLLLCGRGIEVETPPLRCRLLCGRGIEAQTTPPMKKTPTVRLTKIRKEKVVEGGRGGIVNFMAAKPLPSLPMGPVRTLGDNRVGWIPKL